MGPFWQAVVGCGAIVSLVLVFPKAMDAIVAWLSWKAEHAEYIKAEALKSPPFSKVEIVECPNENMVRLNLYKDLGDGPEVVCVTSADLPPWLYRTRKPTRFDVGVGL